MSKEIRCYCLYCKEPIQEGEAYTVGINGTKYHVDCYTQMTTYSDDFGNSQLTEFGESISDEYGY